MEATETYTVERTLAELMTERLASMKMTKAEAALRMNYSRPALSQYLNGKYNSDKTEIEKKIREFLIATGGIPGETPVESVEGSAPVIQLREKIRYFESRDFSQTIGVCQACQENMAWESS